MSHVAPTRRLIVTADDFGRSAGINQAVQQCHREGILTAASLMVNEGACAEAVEMARANPGLGVGLHLTLVCGKSALPPGAIPGLVDETGQFSSRPVAAGYRYFFNRALRPQLRAELQAQFDKFHATGLPLDHVDGHLHMHLHPVVFDLLMENATAWGIRRMRWPRDSFRLSLRLSGGRWGYRVSHTLFFHALCRRARRPLREKGICFTRRVFGLLQDGRVDTRYVLNLLKELPAGDTELYAHPTLAGRRHEYEALVGAEVRALVKALGIRLVRYQDL